MISEYKSGSLLAWRPNSIIGHLICKFTRSEYSHVGILWRFHGRYYVLEAIWNSGVRVRLLQEDLPVVVFPTGVKWNDEVEGCAVRKLGRMYHFVDALRVGLNMNPHIYDSEICSHYVAHVFHKAGMPIPDDKPLRPDDVVNFVLSYNGGKSELITSVSGRKGMLGWWDSWKY